VGERGWQEALGLVFVEALATGLPVVTTRTGGIGDVVEDAVTGFMVEQRSADQIAERLRALYDDRDLLERMSRTGRAVVEQRFSSGDGSQLELAEYPEYIGVDVAPSAVELGRKKFADDPTKSFYLPEDVPADLKADLVLSLDVIYHLVEDAVFDRYMRDLFDRS